MPQSKQEDAENEALLSGSKINRGSTFGMVAVQPRPLSANPDQHEMKLEKKLLDLEKKIRSMSNSREGTETVSQILGSALQARFARQPEERLAEYNRS